MNLKQLKRTIDKLEDVNDNFHIAGNHYGRIDEVIAELKEYYKEEKNKNKFTFEFIDSFFDKLLQKQCDSVCDCTVCPMCLITENKELDCKINFVKEHFTFNENEGKE